MIGRHFIYFSYVIFLIFSGFSFFSLSFMATFCQQPLTCKVKKGKGGQYARLVQRTFERTGMKLLNIQVFWEGHKTLVKSYNKKLTLLICTQHFNIFRCNLRFFYCWKQTVVFKTKCWVQLNGWQLYDKLNFSWW